MVTLLNLLELSMALFSSYLKKKKKKSSAQQLAYHPLNLHYYPLYHM